MEKKENLIRIGVIVTLCIILLVIIVLILLNIKDKRNDEPEESTKVVLPGFEAYNVRCEMKNEDVTDYEEIIVENCEVEDDRILTSRSSIILRYPSKETYEVAKEYESFQDNLVVYNDEENTIEYSQGDVIDFTKDENGEEIVTNFDIYKRSLEELGYICN